MNGSRIFAILVFGRTMLSFLARFARTVLTGSCFSSVAFRAFGAAWLRLFTDTTGFTFGGTGVLALFVFGAQLARRFALFVLVFRWNAWEAQRLPILILVASRFARNAAIGFCVEAVLFLARTRLSFLERFARTIWTGSCFSSVAFRAFGAAWLRLFTDTTGFTFGRTGVLALFVLGAQLARRFALFVLMLAWDARDLEEVKKSLGTTATVYNCNEENIE